MKNRLTLVTAITTITAIILAAIVSFGVILLGHAIIESEFVKNTDSGVSKIYIILITTIVILFIVIWFVWLTYFVVVQYKKTTALSIYLDETTFGKGEDIYFNLVNAKKFPELWNAHEDELKLYCSSREISSIFYRDGAVEDGYRIYIDSSLVDNRMLLALLASIKYNTFEVSYNNGMSTIKANSITDSFIKVLRRRKGYFKKDMFTSNKKHILSNVQDAEAKSHFDKAETGAVSTFNSVKSTSKTLRYQVLYPENHPFVNDFDPHDPNIHFYYVYYGKLYMMKHKHTGTMGSLFEHDIYGLKSATAYVGITASLDAGKTTFPSIALYGITKDIDNSMVDLIDAKLATPGKNEVGLPMWSEETAIKLLGEHMANRMYDVIVKKHYENDHPGEFLSLEDAHKHYADYPWLKGKKSSTKKEK